MSPATSAGRASAPDPRFPWVAFTALAAVLVLHAQIFLGFQVDDAFIALRYADNLRHGLGLTFNPGERVEGFTSPLSIFIDAGFLALGADGLLAAKAFGMACGVATLGLTMWMALGLTASVDASIAAGALLVLQPQVALACVNGLETALFMAWITAIVALHLRCRSPLHRMGVGVCAAGAFLTRPDGALALMLVLADVVVRERPRRGRLVPVMLIIAPFVLIAGPVYAWKVRYFGSFTPNTALAKLPPLNGARLMSGLQYVARYSETHWEVLAYVALAWLAWQGVARFRTLGFFAAAWLASVVFVGGDWIARARFLVPIVPIFCVAVPAFVSELSRRIRAGISDGRLRLVQTATVTAIAGAALVDLAQVRRWSDMTTEGTVRGRESLARWLRDAAPQGTATAAMDVGVLAYLSNQRIIDVGGLTDRGFAQIIHDSPGAYVGHLIFPSASASAEIARETLARRPEFVLVLLYGEAPQLLAEVRAAATGQSPHLPAAFPQDQALVDDPDLRRNYRWICSNLSHRTADGRDVRYNLFARDDVVLKTAPRTDEDGRVACE
jgi:hypothetical protein